MFSHIMIGTNDIEKAGAFYTAVLGVVGAPPPMENINDTGHKRLFFMHAGSIFCLTQPIDGEAATCANGATVGIACDSPEQVHKLHDVAVEHGAKSIEEGPGLRQASMGPMHLCYFRDLDGHKICGLYRGG
ncbi:MAG: VOC family protein [Pseudomonadota bacterium]